MPGRALEEQRAAQIQPRAKCQPGGILKISQAGSAAHRNLIRLTHNVLEYEGPDQDLAAQLER